MTNKQISTAKEDVVLDNPRNEHLNFSKFGKVETNCQEIKSCVLTGKYTSNQMIRPANIVLSKVTKFHSLGAKLEYVDFKDTHVNDTLFENTSFDYGAIINCDFEEVIFRNCTFHNVSITGVEFRKVRFIDCHLDHMVIESCRFKDCEFQDCSTSNKLFECCLFTGSSFLRTDLQIQTIVGNFGITQDTLQNSNIRNKSVKEDYQIMSLSLNDISEEMTVLEKFKLQYFLQPECIREGSKYFDGTFELDNWIESAAIPLTFTNLLSLYQEFLTDLYDSDQIYLFPLIKLHSLTGFLVENKSIDKNTMTAIYGVHMTLANKVEDMLALTSILSERPAQPIVFLVNGPLEHEYYVENLNFIFENNRLNIVKVKKHNSPNELFISWEYFTDVLPIIALFLATRLNFEIERIKTDAVNVGEKTTGNQQALSKSEIGSLPTQKAFQLQLGFDEKQNHLYGLKLKSIFPGNMMVELGLQLSTKKVHQCKNILLEILSSRESENP